MRVTEKSDSFELQLNVIVKWEAMSKNTSIPCVLTHTKYLGTYCVSSATDQMQVAKAHILLWRSAHWN